MTEQSASEVPIVKLWEMSSIPSLSLLQGPLKPIVVALDKVLSIGQIELFDI